MKKLDEFVEEFRDLSHGAKKQLLERLAALAAEPPEEGIGPMPLPEPGPGKPPVGP